MGGGGLTTYVARRVLIALRDEVVDPAVLDGLDRINADLDLIGV